MLRTGSNVAPLGYQAEQYKTGHAQLLTPASFDPPYAPAACLASSYPQERVAALRQQVRLFSSRDHVRALQAGDVWAVVGSSHDLVLVREGAVGRATEAGRWREWGAAGSRRR